MGALIKLGHSREAVLKYTPRNMAAWLFVDKKQRVHERREQIALMRMAMHADDKTIKKALRDDT